MQNNNIKAIAVFTEGIIGTVKFTEESNIWNSQDRIRIDVNIKGLKKKSLHGFHVHEAGD
jgi:Cu/Zn superoxide dismutase